MRPFGRNQEETLMKRLEREAKAKRQLTEEETEEDTAAAQRGDHQQLCSLSRVSPHSGRRRAGLSGARRAHRHT